MASYADDAPNERRSHVAAKGVSHSNCHIAIGQLEMGESDNERSKLHTFSVALSIYGSPKAL
jgi:hypothetical protein